MRFGRLVAVLGVLVVMGCGNAALPAAQGGGVRAPTDPLSLVGTWHLDDAGDASGAVVRLAAGRISIEQGCRTLDGTWRAGWDGLFVAGVTAGSPCPQDTDAAALSTPQWLAQAVRFEPAGTDATLLDASGGRVARLSPSDAPPLPYQEAPESTVTDEARRAWQEPVPLPPAVVADGDLVGRWTPVGGGGSYAEFAATGEWTGSDGCNGDGGRWLTGSAGSFLASQAAATTLLGCPGVPVGSWLGQAARAGFDGATLVLLDASGAEIGRLERL